MSSHIAWLDADETASEQARHLIAATTDVDGGTLDQLGFGGIRDFCSDWLFPGTSTLWSRARYLILVPWCYQGADPRGAQRKLRRALTARYEDPGRPSDLGIIGALKDVERLPDEVLWNGLAFWGVRLAEVSRSGAAASWARRSDPAREDSPLIWHPRLPDRPRDFPKGQRIALTPNEAHFLTGLLTDPVVDLRDRHAKRRHASRLPSMLDEDLTPHLWSWRRVPPSASPQLAQRLRDAARFADLAWSARALYALMVAERADADLDDHRRQLDASEHALRSGSNARVLAAWDFERFKAEVGRERPRSIPALRFLEQWREFVIGARGSLERSNEARDRITNREARVKVNRARLKEANPEPVALASAYDFRAGVSRSIVSDIQSAQP